MLALPVGLATVMGVTQYDKIRNAKISDAGILSSVLSRFSTTSLVDKKEAPVTAPQVQYQFEQAPSLFDPQPQYEDLSENSPVEILNREVQQPVAETSSSQTEVRQTAGSTSAVRAEDPYAVIVGAFRMKENAGKFISELKEKGVEATIYDRSKSGLYRVAVGTFTIREEAEQLLSSVKSGDFSGAWLLVK
jgi:cell division protein FtsN